MRYRIALCGFSEFEYRAMRFSFQHPVAAGATPGYDVVDALSEADFAVVDSDARPAVKGVVLSGYVARSVFVGGAPPPGAVSHLQRPIDTTRILRLLDELVARTARQGPAPGAPGAPARRGDPAGPMGPTFATGTSGPVGPTDATGTTGKTGTTGPAEVAAPRAAPAPGELPTLSEVVGDPFDFFDTVGDPPETTRPSRLERLDPALFGESFGRPEAAPRPAAPAPPSPRPASGATPQSWPAPTATPQPWSSFEPSAPAPAPVPRPPAAGPTSAVAPAESPRRAGDAGSVDAGPARSTAPASTPSASTPPASTAPASAWLAPTPPAPTLPANNPAKVAARANARRARLAATRESGGEPLRDVLVVGPDAEGNVALCTLLERFGFRPAALSTVLQAHQLLADRRPALAAVFLDLPLDDDGLGLVTRVRALPSPPGQVGTTVHLVSGGVEPADRVRIALARLPEPLVKPLARGDVARALERDGVPFPADARRR